MSDDDFTAVAESLTGLFLVVLIGFSWVQGEQMLTMLCVSLLTVLAIARMVVRQA